MAGARVRKLLRELLVRSPWKRFALHAYPYNLAPAELAYLCEAISAVSRVDGCVLEVGCARGQTTVFLNRHMESQGIRKPYFAIDTFEGFLPADVETERRERGKADEDYSGFGVNRQSWFDRTMRLNGFDRVRSIRADVSAFDFSSLPPIAFCFVDVDLYRPVRAALRGVYDLVSAGGFIVVDDCAPGTPFDGALQAYREFVAERGLEERIVLGKLGVLRKA